MPIIILFLFFLLSGVGNSMMAMTSRATTLAKSGQPTATTASLPVALTLSAKDTRGQHGTASVISSPEEPISFPMEAFFPQ
jgi:hypothetical protein